jgi:hypothetical protein
MGLQLSPFTWDHLVKFQLEINRGKKTLKTTFLGVRLLLGDYMFMEWA